MVLIQCLSLDTALSPREAKKISLLFWAAWAQFHTFSLKHHLLTLQVCLPADFLTSSVLLAWFWLQTSSPPLLDSSTFLLLLWSASSNYSQGTFSLWSQVIQSNKEYPSLSRPWPVHRTSHPKYKTMLTFLQQSWI